MKKYIRRFEESKFQPGDKVIISPNMYTILDSHGRNIYGKNDWFSDWFKLAKKKAEGIIENLHFGGYDSSAGVEVYFPKEDRRMVIPNFILIKKR